MAERITVDGVDYVRADIVDARITELLVSNNEKLFRLRHFKAHVQRIVDTAIHALVFTGRS